MSALVSPTHHGIGPIYETSAKSREFHGTVGVITQNNKHLEILELVTIPCCWSLTCHCLGPGRPAVVQAENPPPFRIYARSDFDDLSHSQSPSDHHVKRLEKVVYVRQLFSFHKTSRHSSVYLLTLYIFSITLSEHRNCVSRQFV